MKYFKSEAYILEKGGNTQITWYCASPREVLFSMRNEISLVGSQEHNSKHGPMVFYGGCISLLNDVSVVN